MSLLAHESVAAPDAAPTRRALVAHGILGSRRNWLSFARRLVRRCPDWELILCDLPFHGDSGPAASPTVAACADALARLEGPVHAIIGHSFGGKVALSYARDHARELEQVWVLDANPGPLDGEAAADAEVQRVIAGLRAIPQPLGSRPELVGLLRGAGFSAELAAWMTTNLRRGEGGLVWRFELDAVERLIADYFRADLWAVVETPRVDLEIHLVRAARSDRWTPSLLARLDHLPAGAPTTVHLLEEAGHWLHTDNPEGLLTLMADYL